jgi:hypothetical protein
MVAARCPPSGAGEREIASKVNGQNPASGRALRNLVGSCGGALPPRFCTPFLLTISVLPTNRELLRCQESSCAEPGGLSRRGRLPCRRDRLCGHPRSQGSHSRLLLKSQRHAARDRFAFLEVPVQRSRHRVEPNWTCGAGGACGTGGT